MKIRVWMVLIVFAHMLACMGVFLVGLEWATRVQEAFVMMYLLAMAALLVVVTFVSCFDGKLRHIVFVIGNSRRVQK